VSTDGSVSVSVSSASSLSYAVISSISKSDSDASSVKSPSYGMRTSMRTGSPLKSPVARLPQISSSGCVGAGVVGLADGSELGERVGDAEGSPVGALVGLTEGIIVGSCVGEFVGLSELHPMVTSNVPVAPSTP